MRRGFASRGRRADEQLEVMRLLWEGGPEGVEPSRRVLRIRLMRCASRNRSRTLPVHIGGHSRAAALRAGRFGDGFQPLGVGGDRLTELIGVMRDEAAQARPRRRRAGGVARAPGHRRSTPSARISSRGHGRRPGRAGDASGDRHRRGPRHALGVRGPPGADTVSARGRRSARAERPGAPVRIGRRRPHDSAMWSNYSPTQPNCAFPTRRDRWSRCAAITAATGCAPRCRRSRRSTRTEHAIVGEVYARGGDADYALGRITCIAHHWTVAGESVTDVVWHLRYDDEYLRTGQGWRIHGRALTINAIETPAVRRVRGQPRADRAAALTLYQLRPSASATRTTPPGRSPGTP